MHDPAFYGRIAGDGSIGLGASYADGLWDTSDLMAAAADRAPSRSGALTGPAGSCAALAGR